MIGGWHSFGYGGPRIACIFRFRGKYHGEGDCDDEEGDDESDDPNVFEIFHVLRPFSRKWVLG